MQFMLLFSRQGKLRLQKWYVPLSDKEKKKITRELVQTVLARKPKMCSFLEWRDLKIVYKRISHVLLCNVTRRVSFWFVVTDPSKNHTLPAVEVQSAIRMNRNRINSAFFLNDQTLEFLKIPSTLAPPTDPAVPIWIIIFGVIFCIVIVAITLLVLSGIRQRRRKNKGPSEVDDAEDKCENTITIENGIPCDPLDSKGGHINDVFVTEDERLTPL
ncbi:Collectrin, partial [Sciurus carolinensis]|nr:Collectrin [Sciurus carolinensis]